jgi:hypothetical protein
MALARRAVSERIASIIRMKRISELVAIIDVPSSLILSTLMMEEIRSFENVGSYTSHTA